LKSKKAILSIIFTKVLTIDEDIKVKRINLNKDVLKADQAVHYFENK